MFELHLSQDDHHSNITYAMTKTECSLVNALDIDLKFGAVVPKICLQFIVMITN